MQKKFVPKKSKPKSSNCRIAKHNDLMSQNPIKINKKDLYICYSKPKKQSITRYQLNS